MKKVVISLIMCLLVPCFLFAQNFDVLQSNWNFGTIAEDGGVVKHTFALANNSAQPVVILSAHVTCGCTTYDYPKEPIMPGQSAKVVVGYDPMNRPYRFSSVVRIYTTASAEPVRLTVEGDVIPRARSIEERYAFDMGGGVRFGANYFPLSYIAVDEPRQGAVPIVNQSKKGVAVELRQRKGASGYLNIERKFSVAAGEEFSLPYSYYVPSGDDYYGEVSNTFDIYVDGKRSQYPLTILGHVTDNFELGESAYAEVNAAPRTIRFGTVKRSGGVVQAEFEVESLGVEPLIFRDVKCDKGLTVSVVKGERVSPDQNCRVEVTLDPQQMDYGAFSSYITLTFNAPQQPMVRIRVNGVVER